MYVNVAVAAIAAAGIVIGLTLDTRTAPAQPHALPGKPPDPGERAARRCDRRSWRRSRVGRKGSIAAMQRLGLEHLGGRHAEGALYQRRRAVLPRCRARLGRLSDRRSAALDRAKTLGKNTMIHNQADALNHRGFLQTGPPFYPVFQPSVPNTLLEQGSRLQVEGHQVSAEHAVRAGGEASSERRRGSDRRGGRAVRRRQPAADVLTARPDREGESPQPAVPTTTSASCSRGRVSPRDAIAQFKQTVTLDPKSPMGKQARGDPRGDRQERWTARRR